MAEYGVVNLLVLVVLCAIEVLGSINYGFLIGSLDSNKKDYVAFFLIFSNLAYAFYAANTGDLVVDAIPAMIFAAVFTIIFFMSSKQHEKLVAFMKEEHERKKRDL